MKNKFKKHSSVEGDSLLADNLYLEAVINDLSVYTDMFVDEGVAE